MSRSAYCPNCKMFFEIDNAGCCKECGRQILKPVPKPKKKKSKPS